MLDVANDCRRWQLPQPGHVSTSLHTFYSSQAMMATPLATRRANARGKRRLGFPTESEFRRRERRHVRALGRGFAEGVMSTRRKKERKEKKKEKEWEGDARRGEET